MLRQYRLEQFMACQDSLILSVPIIFKSIYELIDLKILVADVQDYLKVDANTSKQ